MTTATGGSGRPRSGGPLRWLWLLAALAATLLAGLGAQAIAYCLAGLADLGVFGLIGAALPGLGLAGLAVGLGAAADRLLALPPGRAIRLGPAVVAAGSLPWLLPDALRMPTAAGGLPLAAVWAANAAVPLLLVALCLSAHRTRQVVAVVAAALLLAWLPLRHLTVSAAVDRTVERLGSPPRTLLRQIDWPAMTAGTFQYAGGRVTLEYLADGPTPDAGDGVLTVVPVAGTSPCDVPLPQRLDIQPGACLPVGPDLWSRAPCALVLRTSDVLVELVESGPDCPPDEQAALVTAIRSQRPVSDLQLLDLTG